MIHAWQALLGFSAGAHAVVTLHFWRSRLARQYPLLCALLMATCIDELTWNPHHVIPAVDYILLALRTGAAIEAIGNLDLADAFASMLAAGGCAGWLAWFTLEPLYSYAEQYYFLRQWGHTTLALVMLLAALLIWRNNRECGSPFRHALLLAFYFAKFSAAQFVMLYYYPLAAALQTSRMNVYLLADGLSSCLNIAFCIGWIFALPGQRLSRLAP